MCYVCFIYSDFEYLYIEVFVFMQGYGGYFVVGVIMGVVLLFMCVFIDLCCCQLNLLVEIVEGISVSLFVLIDDGCIDFVICCNGNSCCLEVYDYLLLKFELFVVVIVCMYVFVGCDMLMLCDFIDVEWVVYLVNMLMWFVFECVLVDVGIEVLCYLIEIVLMFVMFMLLQVDFELVVVILCEVVEFGECFGLIVCLFVVILVFDELYGVVVCIFVYLLLGVCLFVEML